MFRTHNEEREPRGFDTDRTNGKQVEQGKRLHNLPNELLWSVGRGGIRN